MVAPLGVDDRRQLGSRLLDGRAIRQPAIDAEVLVPAVGPLLIGQRNRRPQLGAIGRGEARRRDADDFIRLAVQPHALADDVRIGCESPGPQSVSEHDAMMLARLRLALRKRAAHDRPGAQQLKESRRHKKRGNLLGDVDAGQVGVPPLVHRPVPDGARLLAPLAKIRGRDVDPIEEVGVSSHRGGDDETIDAGEAVGPQDQRVHQAERRAVGGERERQRDDDRERQQRALDDRAPRIEHIARQSRPPRPLGLHRCERDPADRRLAAQQPHRCRSGRRCPGSAADASAMPALRPTRRAYRACFLAQVADASTREARGRERRRESTCSAKLHDRSVLWLMVTFSRIDSSPLVMLLRASWVARIAFRPAGVTV